MKNGRNLSLSRFLVRVGERLSFRPDSEYAPSVSDGEEEGLRRMPLLQPYLVRIKTALSAAAEESLILSAFCRGVRHLFATRVRVLSGAFFLCGILQILSYFAAARISFLESGTENLVFGAVNILIALLCALVRGTVGDTLLKSLLFSAVLRPYFGVEKWQVPHRVGRDPTLFLMAAAVLEAALSVWLGGARSLFFTLCAVMLVFILFRPEAGLELCAVFLFVFPTSWLFVTVFWTLLSYFFKCAVGKRSLVFSRTDPFLLVALLVLAAVSVITWTEFLFLFSLYFSASGLLRNTAAVKRLFHGFTLSAFLWAGLLLLGLLLGELFPHAHSLYPALTRLFFVKGSLSDGVLFAMLLPLVMGFGSTVRTVSKKLFALIAMVLLVGGIIVVQNGAIWICAIAAAVVWCLFSYRRALLALVMAGLGILCVLQAFPTHVLRKLLGFFGVQSIVSVDGAPVGLLSHTGEIAGAWGVVLLCLVCVLFLFECYRFAGESTAAGVHPAVLGALSAVLALVLASFQPLPWDFRSVALLMILLALPRAAGRAAAREEVRLPY